jgi:lipopolysaccharide transport system permease protein
LPRLAVPLAPVLAGLIDFAIAFVLLLLVMAGFGIAPGMRALLVVPFVILVFVTALGVGLWLATLNVQYRDVPYLLPSLSQLWLFATPIAYPSSLLPSQWHTLYGLNPMAGAIDGFRWALLGTEMHGPMLAVSFTTALTLLAGGLAYFRRMERVFADVV